ncbi:hypothetical protein PFISCL1PPCAC_2790, partial [Pristionchus fissidentatus]
FSEEVGDVTMREEYPGFNLHYPMLNQHLIFMAIYVFSLLIVGHCDISYAETPLNGTWLIFYIPIVILLFLFIPFYRLLLQSLNRPGTVAMSYGYEMLRELVVFSLTLIFLAVAYSMTASVATKTRVEDLATNITNSAGNLTFVLCPFDEETVAPYRSTVPLFLSAYLWIMVDLVLVSLITVVLYQMDKHYFGPKNTQIPYEKHISIHHCGE